jgi:gamma-glutamyltranspeptidase/glutathione hydrolase
MARPHHLAIAAVFVLSSGCSFDLGRTLALNSATPDAGVSVGLVVGDEALAVKAGASMLAHGGSAADAATATYFALAVTDASAAGLGGGGICVVHDPVTHRSEAIAFPAQAPSAGGVYAVPGNVAGFALLQQHFGVLPWQRVISQAENLAATGFPISRVLSESLIASQDIVRLDASLASEFMDENGQIKAAETEVANLELAATLGQIRMHGANGFYRGDTASRIANYARTQGSQLAVAELATSAAAVSAPLELQIGPDRALLPATSSGFAASVSARIKALAAGKSEAEGPQVSPVPEVPRDRGSTGFAARDASGGAVACSVTMNGVFGTGRTAPGTGVTLAGGQPKDTAFFPFLNPAIAVDGGDNVVFSGAAAGGTESASAIVEALAQLSRSANVTAQRANLIVCQKSCVALPAPAVGGVGFTSDAAR